MLETKCVVDKFEMLVIASVFVSNIISLLTFYNIINPWVPKYPWCHQHLNSVTKIQQNQDVTNITLVLSLIEISVQWYRSILKFENLSSESELLITKISIFLKNTALRQIQEWIKIKFSSHVDPWCRLTLE